jgi:hypothetical protein
MSRSFQLSGEQKKFRLLCRDGPFCFYTGEVLDFSLPRDSRDYPTFEHFVAKSLDGNGKIHNMFLCRKWANEEAGNLSPEEKLVLREHWHREFNNADKLGRVDPYNPRFFWRGET